MAAADGGATPLQRAMKMAKEAIRLDGGNRHKEAYCEYLRTINYISHALLEKAGTQKVEVEEERMLRLAEQCLERAKSFIGRNTAGASSSPSEPHQTAANTVLPCHSPVETSRKASSPTKSGHRRALSHGGGELSPFVPPEVFHELQTVESQDTSKRELTPIEQASRLNQKLKANYEARLARLAPGQAYQKTSLTKQCWTWKCQ